MSKGNHDDLVGDVADAITLGLDVQWDRCAQRAAPADRQKIDNLRVIDRVFRSRPAAGDASRTAPAVGSEPRASGFVRRAVAIVWVELAVSLLLCWLWDSLYRTNGDLLVDLADRVQ